MQGKAKPIEVPEKETTVMFVLLPRIFSESLWKAWKQAPNKGVMAWAAKYQLHFVDTFGWKEQRTDQGIEQLFGMIRVDGEPPELPRTSLSGCGGTWRCQRLWVLQGAPMEWGTNDALLVLKSSFQDAVITKFTPRTRTSCRSRRPSMARRSPCWRPSSRTRR